VQIGIQEGGNLPATETRCQSLMRIGAGRNKYQTNINESICNWGRARKEALITTPHYWKTEKKKRDASAGEAGLVVRKRPAQGGGGDVRS